MTHEGLHDRPAIINAKTDTQCHESRKVEDLTEPGLVNLSLGNDIVEPDRKCRSQEENEIAQQKGPPPHGDPDDQRRICENGKQQHQEIIEIGGEVIE